MNNKHLGNGVDEEVGVADTDGNWLPDSARHRLARYDAAGLRTSLLPVAGAVGVESVGLSPVGEVMGCIVQYIGLDRRVRLRLVRARYVRRR